MIIQSGNVAMASRRSYDRTTAVSSVSFYSGMGQMQNRSLQLVEHYSEESDSGENSNSKDGSLENDLFNEFKQAQSIGSPVSITSQPAMDLKAIQEQSINYLLMLFFGKGNLKANPLSNSNLGQPLNLLQQTGGGIYMEQTDYAYRREEETTSFSTTGTVKTADGREIRFQLSMEMSRSFEETYSRSVSYAALNQAALCDPLVINLNTDAASVSDQTFYFDLDADGSLDEISQLSSGSGFLALDKNGDGKINDGNELFGTKSGDGFSDLAAYDEDGNGWIDENDSIFHQLRIWTKDAAGKDVLYTLAKAGVGAIYLGSAQTDFALNSAKDNSTNALIRKTGIFLYENGGCGTMQHLDLAKQQSAKSGFGSTNTSLLRGVSKSASLKA